MGKVGKSLFYPLSPLSPTFPLFPNYHLALIQISVSSKKIAILQTSRDMLLTIDVGNSNTVIGLFNGSNLVDHWRIQTVTERTADEYTVLLRGLFEDGSHRIEDMKGCAISSVVPSVERQLEKWGNMALSESPRIVGKDLSSTIDVRIQNPEQIGADRLVNAHGAYDIYGENLIVVDFGTATTFDAVSVDGAYLGGVIAPGIVVSSEALFDAASKLPRVDMAKPDNVVGKSTVEAMQSGLYYGSVGMVTEIIELTAGEFDTPPTVVATGGLAERISTDIDKIDQIDEHLTLRGLAKLYRTTVE